MSRFSITTLGCKVNQYDGAAVRSALAAAGLQVADPPADLVVINTCCVTTTAMRKSRQAIRRAVRSAPGAAVLVTGCYCDYDAARISALLASLGVPSGRAFLAGHHGDLAAGVRQVARAVGMSGGTSPGTPSCPPSLEDQEGRGTPVTACRDAGGTPRSDAIKSRRRIAVKQNVKGAEALGPIARFDGHQRAFVKVQDGCDAFCAYCVVPYLRCRVRSRRIDEIEAECRALVAAGHKEIVLCGVFLGAFGRSTAIRRRWNGQASQLPELLRRVAAIEGLWRVRLSSLEPLDLDGRLLGCLRELPKFAPHLHLPLQSGSERILRRMNRQYAPDDFRRAVDALRAALDRPAITTDILVGFPGETDEDFDRTLSLARYAGFAKIHAFPFSAIEGAAAWTYRREAPPPRVVRERMAALAELERQLAAAFRRQFVGQTMEGIVERCPVGLRARRCQPPQPSEASPHGLGQSTAANGAAVAPESRRVGKAMTDRYLSVFFGAGDVRLGGVVALRITGIQEGGLSGLVL